MSLPDIRLQIAAVTLASDLNFSRAAERLNITQPALSKQIAELESRLGFVVFDRHPRRVDLTQAGQVFVRGCKDSLAILEKAVRTARTTHEDFRPVITIGHSPYIDPGFISSLLGVQLPLYPNLRFKIESMFPHELIHGVLSAELDLAIIEEALTSPSLTHVVLQTHPLCALMSADHPSACRRRVSITDFTDVGWMMFPKRANSALYEKVVGIAQRAGVEPVEIHHYLAPQEVVQLISENFGIAIMPQGIAEQLALGGLVARPFEDPGLQVDSHLVMSADQASRLVNEFGRTFLKRVSPKSPRSSSFGQMALDL